MAYQLVYIADSLKKILSTKKHLISPVSGFIGAPSSYNVLVSFCSGSFYYCREKIKLKC